MNKKKDHKKMMHIKAEDAEAFFKDIDEFDKKREEKIQKKKMSMNQVIQILFQTRDFTLLKRIVDYMGPNFFFKYLHFIQNHEGWLGWIERRKLFELDFHYFIENSYYHVLNYYKMKNIYMKNQNNVNQTILQKLVKDGRLEEIEYLYSNPHVTTFEYKNNTLYQLNPYMMNEKKKEVHQILLLTALDKSHFDIFQFLKQYGDLSSESYIGQIYKKTENEDIQSMDTILRMYIMNEWNPIKLRLNKKEPSTKSLVECMKKIFIRGVERENHMMINYFFELNHQLEFNDILPKKTLLNDLDFMTNIFVKILNTHSVPLFSFIIEKLKIEKYKFDIDFMIDLTIHYQSPSFFDKIYENFQVDPHFLKHVREKILFYDSILLLESLSKYPFMEKKYTNEELCKYHSVELLKYLHEKGEIQWNKNDVLFILNDLEKHTFLRHYHDITLYTLSKNIIQNTEKIWNGLYKKKFKMLVYIYEKISNESPELHFYPNIKYVFDLEPAIKYDFVHLICKYYMKNINENQEHYYLVLKNLFIHSENKLIDCFYHFGFHFDIGQIQLFIEYNYDGIMIFQLLKKIRDTLTEEDKKKILYSIVQYGRMNILKNMIFYLDYSYSEDSKLVEIAIENLNIECFQYLHKDLKIPLNEHCWKRLEDNIKGITKNILFTSHPMVIKKRSMEILQIIKN